MSIYREMGYESRREYLSTLAEDFGIPFSVVRDHAMILGRSEDFDGLLNYLEDYVESQALLDY